MKDQTIFESLNVVDEYILKLINGVENAVRFFKQQNEDEGVGLLIQIIDGLSWTIEAVFDLKALLEDQGFDTNVEELNDLLKELLSAMENEDYVLISDLLQYEVLEILLSWKKITEKAILIH